MTTPRTLNDEDSLLSPTSSWFKGTTTPMNSLSKNGNLIHTGGMDLGTLLSQDMQSNQSDGYIFTDDNNSTDSPANSSRMSEADLSRVSTVLGVPEDEQPDDTKFVWSDNNPQRGRQVAQYVLQRARSKENLQQRDAQQHPPITNNKSRSSMGMILRNGKSDDKTEVVVEKEFVHRSKKDRLSNASSLESTKTTKSKGLWKKYLNRLRRRRRKILDSLFSSGAAIRAVASHEEQPPIGSQGSTDSAESLEQLYTVSGSHDAVVDDTSPRSVYIEGSDKELVDSGSFFSRDTAPIPEAKPEDPTPKRSNRASSKSRAARKSVMARLKAPYHMRATPNRRKTMGDAADDSSTSSNQSNHRPSQVVDSILRSAQKSKSAVRRSVGHVGQRASKDVEEEKDLPEHESSAAISELLKLGKDGDKYMALLRKEQVKKQQEKDGRNVKRGDSLLDCDVSEASASEDDVPVFKLDQSVLVPNYETELKK